MLKKPVAVAILAALSIGVVANVYADTSPTTSPTTSLNLTTAVNIDAAPQDTTQQSTTTTDQSSTSTTDQKAKKLDTVVVSGSLINNAQIQTATPTYTITAADIKARGFNSVTEVLQNAVQATGSVQGPATSGGFTQGAQTVSLYGLPPEFTLILIDGKPVTNFGQLYNGQSNFQNISNIPISMVDHVDIIPGGGSSIYGSAAIAGTINIVTKQHMDGGEIDVRTGDYDGGGGANQRLNAAWGHQFGKLDVLSAIEFDNSSPLWGFQRPLTDGSTHDPAGTTPELVTGIETFGTGANPSAEQTGFLSPPNGCGAIGGLFGGSTVAASLPASQGLPGQFCGSQKVNGYTTLLNQSRSYDGLLKLRYDVNDNVRLYADVLTDWQQQKYTQGAQFNFWEPLYFPGGPNVQDQYGNIVDPVHIFAPEEIPGGIYNNLFNTQDDLLYTGDVGANGHFGDSGWDWDVYFQRSGDRTSSDDPERSASAVDAYFGQFFTPTGQTNSVGNSIYNINYAGFFSPIPQSAFSAFTQNVDTVTNTWINNSRFTVNNSSLFSLPGGDAGLAVLAEGGSEAWYQPANPFVENGEIWGLTGTSGGGQRQHKGAAFEFNAPIFKQLTLDVSGRYDYYTIPNNSNNKFTYKVALEYRPFDTWLLRANYSTAFRAPDLSTLYLGPSGFFEALPDPYLCALAHSTNCGLPQFVTEFEGNLLSNPALKPTTANSWTVGTVWAPIDNLSLSVDLLSINVSNEIAEQDIPTLLALDSQCLLGQLPAGSSECVQTEKQVIRNGAGVIQTVNAEFQNLASEDARSITAQAKYKFPQTFVGQFSAELDYNDLLKHTVQLFPGSPPINDLTNSFYSSEFKDITSGDISWNFHDVWSSTLYWHRDSPSPNFIGLEFGPSTPGAGRVGVWNTFNWSLTYSPVQNVDLSLLVNNVFNKMPPNDPTFSSYPYFNDQNYNVYGRETMLQVSFRFGSAAK
jgi:outer membrane receptor protein involved in Fe transport